MYLLGYDIGSSSVKAALVDAESGKTVASAFYPKTEAPIISKKPGWAEQDPAMWLGNLKLATEDVLHQLGDFQSSLSCASSGSLVALNDLCLSVLVESLKLSLNVLEYFFHNKNVKN